MGQYTGDKVLEKQKAVVDASVAAKWYLEEEYSDEARLLRDSFVTGSLSISVPTLFFYETLNALRYSRVFDQAELGEAATSLSKYGLDVWHPSGRLLAETATLSLKHDATMYDASYVALSSHLHVQLYTADRDIVAKFPSRTQHVRTFKE